MGNYSADFSGKILAFKSFGKYKAKYSASLAVYGYGNGYIPELCPKIRAESTNEVRPDLEALKRYIINIPGQYKLIHFQCYNSNWLKIHRCQME